jgi:hypothetical protein
MRDVLRHRAAIAGGLATQPIFFCYLVRSVFLIELMKGVPHKREDHSRREVCEW